MVQVILWILRAQRSERLVFDMLEMTHCSLAYLAKSRALYTPPPMPTGVLDSYQTGLGLGQISCWLITIQILYPSPSGVLVEFQWSLSGVLVNSYWNDPKS